MNKKHHTNKLDGSFSTQLHLKVQLIVVVDSCGIKSCQRNELCTKKEAMTSSKIRVGTLLYTLYF